MLKIKGTWLADKIESEDLCGEGVSRHLQSFFREWRGVANPIKGTPICPAQSLDCCASWSVSERLREYDFYLTDDDIASLGMDAYYLLREIYFIQEYLGLTFHRASTSERKRLIREIKKLPLRLGYRKAHGDG